ncbi:MAG: EamA family transporter [Proteobacteria bacterium]|nr:EamA family transporter [Pseudomonadota bacterium]
MSDADGPHGRGMSPVDLASALLIVVIWGSNFVVMKVGLRDMGPMMLGALRFAFASLPLLLFVRRPDLPWRYIAGYGLAQGFGQFGFVFLGLWLGMPAGVASIVLQTQAFFTAMLGAVLLHERTRASQWIGLVIAAGGLALIALPHGGGAVGRVPVTGFLLCIAGAAMWAVSNIVARLAQRHNPRYDAVSLVVWGSTAPIVPFLVLAVLQDGADATLRVLAHPTWPAAASVLYLALVATVAAYSMWARLLKRHPAGKVAPFSLLVPVVGLYAAWLAFDEQLAPAQWLGVAGVGLGLVVSNFGHRFGDLVRAGIARRT